MCTQSACAWQRRDARGPRRSTRGRLEEGRREGMHARRRHKERHRRVRCSRRLGRIDSRRRRGKRKTPAERHGLERETRIGDGSGQRRGRFCGRRRLLCSGLLLQLVLLVRLTVLATLFCGSGGRLGGGSGRWSGALRLLLLLLLLLLLRR